MSITTGRVLNRLHATALPMPDEVIDKIHRMARQQKTNPGLVFADRNLNPDDYDDDEDDETYHDEDNSDDEDDDDDDDADHHDDNNNGDENDEDDDTYHDDNNVDNEDEDGLSDDEEEDNNNHENEDLEGTHDAVDNDDGDASANEDEAPGSPNTEADAAVVPPGVDDNNNHNGGGVHSDVQQPVGAGQPDNPDHHDDADEEDDLLGIPGVDDENVGPETPGVGENGDEIEEGEPINQPPAGRGGGRYNLRRTRGRDYDHRYAGDSFIIDEVAMTTHGAGEVLETPQMSLKAGLRTFGNDGVKAVEKEMRQLHDRGVMIPVQKESLTLEQRKEALAYLMFLKRKRCGKVEGRRCADGRKQRAYIAKEEATAPTVSTEAVFLTAIIDTLEGREVAVLDVPGAFMQADIDELVHVRFTDEMVNMLLHIGHDKYKDYVVTEREDKVLYMELLKALYGTLRAARLFWEKLSKQLIEIWGFTPNKYDDCVVNKTINGHQMTVVWHVDDLKVSHVDKKEVDKFIEQMEAEYGTEAPLSISRGKVHDYLGMNLDFRVEGEVRIDMEHYIDMMLHDAPEDMNGVSNTPAAAHLFKTNLVDPKLLDDKKKKMFVHLVMQGLYLSQHGRPDIRTAISFLCGRLHNPDEDDYKKLT